MISWINGRKYDMTYSDTGTFSSFLISLEGEVVAFLSAGIMKDGEVMWQIIQ